MQLSQGFCIIASMTLETEIKQQALELGFDAVGITDACPIDADQAGYLSAWLEAGFAGQMQYMHRNFEKRIDPSGLLEDARSVIVVALNYKPHEHAGCDISHLSNCRVARYALYEDYHPFIKQRLRKLAEFIASAADENIRFKICVDSVPLAERALAVRAGLGFLGKNHMLISPALGPEIFLGEIITTLKLQGDKPIHGECSACTKCVDACPTGALQPDGRFDANKCISYLTIEHKGQITPEQAHKIDNRLFGCDECVNACPHRKDAPPCANKDFKFYSDRAMMTLKQIQAMTEEQFQCQFQDSPIKRLGLERLKRNAKICTKPET